MTGSIGEILKKARESKNLTIQYVSEKTRMPKNIISGIEEDSLGGSYSPFYVKGFLKTYARFLGVSEEETVKKRLEGIEAGKTETRPETQAATASAPAKERKKIKLPAVNMGPYLKYAAIIAAVIFAVRVSAPLFKSLSKIRLPRPAPKVEKIVVKKQAPAPAAAPAQKISAPSKSGMVELEIKAASNNWIQVTADGEILFKGVLRKGSQERWQAKKEIWLWLSDAGGANVTVNGKDIGVLGKKDEKKSGIIIDKEGIQ